MLDGIHLVQSYLERFAANEIELVIRASAMQHQEVKVLTERATSVTVTDSLFDQLRAVESPVGILAVAALPRVDQPAGRGFQILVDGVQDPGNLGSILRSAAAAGATLAHLSRKCADPWSPKSLRGGMGAQFHLPVREHQDLAAAAKTLGARLIACTPTGRLSVFDVDLSGNIAFVVGGEGAGIAAELLSLTQQQVRIPMRASIESLNAAQAATLCFYEWLRRAPRE